VHARQPGISAIAGNFIPRETKGLQAEKSSRRLKLAVKLPSEKASGVP
jgi:hypothetical protein